MFPLGHKMTHFLRRDLLVCVGAKLPHSINFVLGSENGSYHLLSSSVQGKKRAVTCFTSLSPIPSNTSAPREHRVLPNTGIQNLKTPTSLTRQHFIAHSSLAAPCSPLGPNHPLSTFIREMLTLAVSRGMCTS